MISCTVLPPLEFQFTHPVRGATKVIHLLHEALEVSIHAPREGCDVWATM